MANFWLGVRYGSSWNSGLCRRMSTIVSFGIPKSLHRMASQSPLKFMRLSWKGEKIPYWSFASFFVKPLIFAASSLILTFSFYFFFLVIFFNPKSLLDNPIFSLLNNRSYPLVTKITSLIFPDHFLNIFKLSITWITYILHYFLNHSQTTHIHKLLMGQERMHLHYMISNTSPSLLDPNVCRSSSCSSAGGCTQAAWERSSGQWVDCWTSKATRPVLLKLPASTPCCASGTPK